MDLEDFRKKLQFERKSARTIADTMLRDAQNSSAGQGWERQAAEYRGRSNAFDDALRYLDEAGDVK